MPELIDRQAALEVVMRYCPDDDGSCSKAGHDIREMLDEIEALPTIEPEVMHGHWIAVSSFDACGGDEEVWMAHGNPIAYHYCSECKNEAYANEEGKEILSDYCPFCGADLRDIESWFMGDFNQCDNCPDWDDEKGCKSHGKGCEDGGVDNG